MRETMVEEQLQRRGITDLAVLRAMRRVPRHEFVPLELRGEAYDDGPLPIGAGQTISQPYMVALMTEKLGLAGNEKALEIGTGLRISNGSTRLVRLEESLAWNFTTSWEGQPRNSWSDWGSKTWK